MKNKNIVGRIVNNIFRVFLSAPVINDDKPLNPKKILVVRQHNQLGDLIANIPLFRSIKETYPQSHLTVILSPVNYQGLINSSYIDRAFIFDKKKLFESTYFKELKSILNDYYDIIIVPSTVSISFTSNLLSRMAKGKLRIGAASLNGESNPSSYFFNKLVNIDWELYPDMNIYERSIDFVKEIGISTNDFRAEIIYDERDLAEVKGFIKEMNKKPGEVLIGIHCGAGKPQNRWSLEKYANLLKEIKKNYKAHIYLTGSNSDSEEINHVLSKLDFKPYLYLNKTIPQVAALVDNSDLFIGNDTGIMHVAGATNTPQISIFGPTNPFIWAPLGSNKFFIRKSDLIDDVEVSDVMEIVKKILG